MLNKPRTVLTHLQDAQCMATSAPMGSLKELLNATPVDHKNDDGHILASLLENSEHPPQHSDGSSTVRTQLVHSLKLTLNGCGVLTHERVQTDHTIRLFPFDTRRLEGAV